MSLGVAALRQSDLVEVARRDAGALSEATTCSVLLTTWGNRGPAIVYRVDGKRRGPTSVRVGYVLPLWRSASGRVFLAYLPEREMDGGDCKKKNRISRRREVAAEIARIRADRLRRRPAIRKSSPGSPRRCSTTTVSSWPR